ncbi:MAG TPA: hypothetical protein VFE50_16490 [Cyclobacteriaceae bacterium]|nr:hypothetical protein [Cyclobacteriaceae bacterium]
MRLKFMLLPVLLLFATYSYACKCGGPGTVKESFIGGEVIVSGRVLRKELIAFSQTINPDSVSVVKARLNNDKQKLRFFEMNYIFKIDFQITDKYKGLHLTDTVTIYTAMNSASCGYKFEVGKYYIVYARKENDLSAMFLGSDDRNRDLERKDTYWTNHCTRTTEYNSMEAEELRALCGN